MGDEEYNNIVVSSFQKVGLFKILEQNSGFWLENTFIKWKNNLLLQKTSHMYTVLLGSYLPYTNMLIIYVIILTLFLLIYAVYSLTKFLFLLFFSLLNFVGIST